MITKEQKQNVFKPMLENFETEQIKEYFLDMVAEIPDYIFTMPSSTSGKYHNKTQCETYGQLWHVYMFSSILNHRLRLKGNQDVKQRLRARRWKRKTQVRSCSICKVHYVNH